MKKIRPLLTAFPECYLIIFALLSGYTPPFYINPISIVLAIMLVFQIILKNKITGVIISNLFILLNLFMLFALLSEFKEFQNFNSEAKQLVFLGIPLIILNFLVAGLMVYKYLRRGDQNDSPKDYNLTT